MPFHFDAYDSICFTLFRYTKNFNLHRIQKEMKKIILFVFVVFAGFELLAQRDTALTNERKIFVYSPKRSDALFTKIKLDINGTKVSMPVNSTTAFSVTGKKITIQILNEHATIRNGDPLTIVAKDRNYFIAARVMKGAFKESFEVQEICESCYLDISSKSKKKVSTE
jgi:hypothetical protein